MNIKKMLKSAAAVLAGLFVLCSVTGCKQEETAERTVYNISLKYEYMNDGSAETTTQTVNSSMETYTLFTPPAVEGKNFEYWLDKASGSHYSGSAVLTLNKNYNLEAKYKTLTNPVKIYIYSPDILFNENGISITAGDYNYYTNVEKDSEWSIPEVSKLNSSDYFTEMTAENFEGWYTVYYDGAASYTDKVTVSNEILFIPVYSNCKVLAFNVFNSHKLDIKNSCIKYVNHNNDTDKVQDYFNGGQTCFVDSWTDQNGNLISSEKITVTDNIICYVNDPDFARPFYLYSYASYDEVSGKYLLSDPFVSKLDIDPLTFSLTKLRILLTTPTYYEEDTFKSYTLAYYQFLKSEDDLIAAAEDLTAIGRVNPDAYDETETKLYTPDDSITIAAGTEPVKILAVWKK